MSLLPFFKHSILFQGGGEGKEIGRLESHFGEETGEESVERTAMSGKEYQSLTGRQVLRMSGCDKSCKKRGYGVREKESLVAAMK